MTLITNALYLAWSDTRARYKKSILGPLWLTLGNLIGVLGLSLVWGTLLNEDLHNFVPSLAIGLIIWQLIAGTIGEAPTTFIRQANVIRNIVTPTWFFVVRGLSRQLINLAHNIVIVIGVMIYFKTPLHTQTLLFIPGLILVMLNLYWVTYLLGMLGARFRDIEYLINALLPLLFFISPVIFRADRLPISMSIIWLNPLSYFIEVIRAPLLGNIPEIKSYVVMLSLLLAGSTITTLYAKHQGKKLSFWI